MDYVLLSVLFSALSTQTITKQCIFYYSNYNEFWLASRFELLWFDCLSTIVNNTKNFGYVKNLKFYLTDYTLLQICRFFRVIGKRGSTIY